MGFRQLLHLGLKRFRKELSSQTHTKIGNALLDCLMQEGFLVDGVRVSVFVIDMRCSTQDYKCIIPGGIRKMIPSDVNQMVESFIFIQDGAYAASRIFMDMLEH